jgi:hypothetical protein
MPILDVLQSLELVHDGLLRRIVGDEQRLPTAFGCELGRSGIWDPELNLAQPFGAHALAIATNILVRLGTALGLRLRHVGLPVLLDD